MATSAPAAPLAPAGLDPRRWQALALLCGAFFMVLLDGTITIVALPSVGADLRFSEQGLQWVLSAYALAFDGLLLLGGRAPDLLGRRRVFMLTITGALVLLVYGIVQAPGTGWGNARTILPLAASALLLAAFPLIESRHPAPLVPLRILRSRTLAAADALTVLLGTVAVGLPFVLTLFAQQVLGYSALRFGISSVALAVSVTAGAIAGQGAVLKAGFRPVAAAGLALLCAGSVVLTQVSVHGGYFPVIFFGLLVSGLGIGLAFVTATTAGYQSAFVSCAVLAGIGLVLALLLPGRGFHRPRQG
jgi:MFS family permease